MIFIFLTYIYVNFVLYSEVLVHIIYCFRHYYTRF